MLSQGWRPGGFACRIPGMFYSPPPLPPPPSQLRTQSRSRVLSLGRRVKLDLCPSGAEPTLRRRGEWRGLRPRTPSLRRLASQRLQSPAGLASSGCPAGRARRLCGAVVSPVLGHNLPFLLRDTGGYWLLQLPPDFRKRLLASGVRPLVGEGALPWPRGRSGATRWASRGVTTSSTSCGSPPGRQPEGRGRGLRTRGGALGGALGGCSLRTVRRSAAVWVAARPAGLRRGRLMGVASTSASVCSRASATPTEMVSWVRTMGEKLKQRLRLDVGREICRQYPLFCFLLLCLSVASLLLNR